MGQSTGNFKLAIWLVMLCAIFESVTSYNEYRSEENIPNGDYEYAYYEDISKSSESLEKSSGGKTTKKPENDAANVKPEDKEILKGRKAKQGEAPYQLSLWLNNGFVCGATLVTSVYTGMQFGITSAHCVANSDSTIHHYPEEFVVGAGELNMHKGQRLRVANYAIPETWHGFWSGDIALIFFQGQFEESENLKPIYLTDSRYGNLFRYVTVSGWNAAEEYGRNHQKDLQVAKLWTINSHRCNQMHRWDYGHNWYVIDESQFCVVPDATRSMICATDTGGPVIVKSKEGLKLIGVVGLWQGN